MADYEGKLGLADFLSDLRAELDEAVKRADGQSLKLVLDEVTLSLDVGFTVARKGEGSVGAQAKFWVFASVDGSVRGELSYQRVDTQRLTLTLKPHIEQTWVDESGTVQRSTRSADVAGRLERGEENPPSAVPNAESPAAT